MDVYAGIGTRRLPPREVPRLRHVARVLECRGYMLRSGGARGADAAFEDGVSDPANAQIFLPLPGFNAHRSTLHAVTPEALELAARFTRCWSKLDEFSRLAKGRNCHVILGQDLASPCKFVVCWTPGGRVVGGTGHALRVAYANTIPVFNLAEPDASSRLAEFVRQVAA